MYHAQRYQKNVCHWHQLKNSLTANDPLLWWNLWYSSRATSNLNWRLLYRYMAVRAQQQTPNFNHISQVSVAQLWPGRSSWCTDVNTWAYCGTTNRVIAFIEYQQVIGKILSQLKKKDSLQFSHNALTETRAHRKAVCLTDFKIVWWFYMLIPIGSRVSLLANDESCLKIT